jgi:acyl dehydratase
MRYRYAAVGVRIRSLRMRVSLLVWAWIMKKIDTDRSQPAGTSQSRLAAPPPQRYFEDYLPGSVYEFGEITVTEAEIVSFAQQFDPQYFHVDAEAAARGPFGGLVASGWHTGSLAMRLYVDHYLAGAVSLGSPGMDELRFHRPVRPGDRLSIRMSVLEATRSRSKPERGFVTARMEVLNQHGEVAMSLKVTSIMGCRKAAP